MYRQLGPIQKIATGGIEPPLRHQTLLCVLCVCVHPTFPVCQRECVDSVSRVVRYAWMDGWMGRVRQSLITKLRFIIDQAVLCHACAHVLVCFLSVTTATTRRPHIRSILFYIYIDLCLYYKVYANTRLLVYLAPNFWYCCWDRPRLYSIYCTSTKVQ